MKRTRLVIVGPEGKINMGFIIRLAKNFSVDDICVVKPQFDITDPEVIEFSAKASDYVKKVRVAERLDDCIEGSKVVVCTTAKSRYESDVLRQGIPPNLLPYVLPKTGVVSLVFGRESVGLTRDELLKCDIISTLETGSEYNVLNLSHAVAIYLYELSKGSVGWPPLESECSEQSLSSIRKVLEELKELTGEERGVVALRHAIFRSGLRKPECGAIYRLLKKIKYGLLRNGGSTNP